MSSGLQEGLLRAAGETAKRGIIVLLCVGILLGVGVGAVVMFFVLR